MNCFVEARTADGARECVAMLLADAGWQVIQIAEVRPTSREEWNGTTLIELFDQAVIDGSAAVLDAPIAWNPCVNGRSLTRRWSGLRPAALVRYLARASSGPKPLSSERWADRMTRRHLPLFFSLIGLLSCGLEPRPVARLEGGSVKIICGSPERPCNFHIVAPKELTRACVSVDDTQTVSLLPSSVEHPYRTLLLRSVGIDLPSQTSVATAYLPAGPHVVRISQFGWETVEQTVLGTGSRQPIELVVRNDQLRKAAGR